MNNHFVLPWTCSYFAERRFSGHDSPTFLETVKHTHTEDKENPNLCNGQYFKRMIPSIWLSQLSSQPCSQMNGYRADVGTARSVVVFIPNYEFTSTSKAFQSNSGIHCCSQHSSHRKSLIPEQNPKNAGRIAHSEKQQFQAALQFMQHRRSSSCSRLCLKVVHDYVQKMTNTTVLSQVLNKEIK